MKRISVVVICLFLLVMVAGVCYAGEGTEVNVNVNIGNNVLTDVRSETLFSVGITSPVVGSAQTKYFGETKYTTSISGINWCLGYTKRNYFGKGLPGNGGAAYFEYGTIAILCPFLGIGYDFRIDDNLLVGIGFPDVFHFGFTF